LRGHFEELSGIESVAPIAATTVEAAGDEDLSIPEQRSCVGCAAARQSRDRQPLFEIAVEYFSSIYGEVTRLSSGSEHPAVWEHGETVLVAYKVGSCGFRPLSGIRVVQLGAGCGGGEDFARVQENGALDTS
jgi:hypothetical protein